jgi:periplasmic divalent cation tolerance protein
MPQTPSRREIAFCCVRLFDIQIEAAMNPTKACVVMTTVSSKEEAEKIARAVLEARLAACVQIQEITSYYWWDDKINREGEQLLYLKTTPDKYHALEALLIANHSYDTPEILQLPIEAGFEKYLGWIQRETSQGGP